MPIKKLLFKKKKNTERFSFFEVTVGFMFGYGCSIVSTEESHKDSKTNKCVCMCVEWV